MRALTLVTAALALASCRRDELPPAPDVGEAAFHERAAFLSVTGTGPDDVWAVGARPSPTEGPVILHLEEGSWSTVDSGQRHDLWWAHAFEDGTVFAGGAGATVLRIRDDVVERLPTPAFFGNTVYGVWGTSPEDVWAVGGFAARDGFVWRWDGAAWSEIALPDDLPRNSRGEPVALFKVWGRSVDDVWIVGGEGTVLHWDGAALELVPSGTDEQLFTVTGNAEEVAIVGGSASGILLRGGLDGLVDDTPPRAPLLQAVAFDVDDTLFTAGANGFAMRQVVDQDWERVDLDLTRQPQSVHALWTDGEGHLWAAGGSVLTPELDMGLVCGPDGMELWGPEDPIEPDTSCPADQVDPAPDRSIARRWNEQILNSIRRDIPHPPKHARNLHHVSVAMYDAWATWQDVADGVVYTERHTSGDLDEARRVSISYAAYRVLVHRYTTAVGATTSLDCYDGFMDVLGLDPGDTHTDGDDPIAVGNRIGAAVIARFAEDGANEAENYADTTGWEPYNPVMIVDRAGTNVEDPDVWQQLNLGTAETQNGIVLEDSVQPYIGAHWRNVEPFAIELDGETGLYSDPGPRGYPTVDDPLIAEQVLQVIRRTSYLDTDDGVQIEIGPRGRGNNSLGEDDGEGYALNPVTGEPYAEDLVPRGDFARVVAELWADGPTSETPPGHWMVLSDEVSDRLAEGALVPFGEGEPVDRLAWDVGLYLIVSAANHDGAISAWELKRDSLSPRPITLVRWMAQNGQRTDPDGPSYDPDGLPLEPGLVEVITEASSAPGERHHHLRWYVGEIAVWSWPGEPGDRDADYTPLRWMRAKDWIPYQRRTFVTPAFPGFTSGHSTFSRASAEALTAYTGTPFFPGGLHEYVARKDAYLVFEEGPSVDVHLQWATYQDAADQAGQSRLYGGIHLFADDSIGRINGARVGLAVSEKARAYLDGTAR